MRSMLAMLLAAVVASPAASQTLPAYRIVAEQKTETSRTVDVRVERRLSRSEIEALANAIADREGRPYPRTVVNLLLPDMRVNEPAWASATLNRDLRINIPGLSLEEERQHVAEAGADKRDIVGAWLTSSTLGPGRVTIYRDGERLMAEWLRRGNLKSAEALREIKVDRGRRFEPLATSRIDAMIVNGEGHLELWSGGNREAVAQSIRAAGSKPVATAKTDREPWPAVDRASAGLRQAGAGTPALGEAAIEPVTARAADVQPLPAPVAGSRPRPRPASPPATSTIDMKAIFGMGVGR